jgi:hypothetical protein
MMTSFKIADLVKPHPVSDGIAFQYVVEVDATSVTYRGNVARPNFDAFGVHHSSFNITKHFSSDNFEPTAEMKILAIDTPLGPNIANDRHVPVEPLSQTLKLEKHQSSESITASSSDAVAENNSAVMTQARDEIKVVVSISEDTLCLYRGGKLEKSELRGILGVQLQSSLISGDPPTLNDLNISIHDKQKVLCRIAANKQYISDLTESDAVEEHRSAAAHSIPTNSEKIIPLLKYTAIPAFEPSLLRARSKVKVVMPNAKVYVQISLNPVYRSTMESVLIQASVSGKLIIPAANCTDYIYSAIDGIFLLQCVASLPLFLQLKRCPWMVVTECK